MLVSHNKKKRTKANWDKKTEQDKTKQTLPYSDSHACQTMNVHLVRAIGLNVNFQEYVSWLHHVIYYIINGKVLCVQSVV